MFEVGSTVLTTLAAVAMAIAYVVGSRPSNSQRPVEDWESWAEDAHVLGEATAADHVVLAAFMDFTCPYCRRAVPVLDSLKIKYGADLRIEFLHFPLDGHEFAMPAAVAAECAAEQGRFRSMYDALFESFDSLGHVAWDAIAAGAGVPDHESFVSCMERPPETFLRIARGLTLGESAGVRGTPTLFIDGRMAGRRTVVDLSERIDGAR
jgi:protein-disulfide isomerase